MGTVEIWAELPNCRPRLIAVLFRRGFAWHECAQDVSGSVVRRIRESAVRWPPPLSAAIHALSPFGQSMPKGN
jgi:hypothetical protein